MSGLHAVWLALNKSGLRAIELEHPWFLLALIPLAVAVVCAFFFDRSRPTFRFARGDDAAALPRGAGAVARFASMVLMAIAAVLVTLTLASPFVRGEPDPATSEGIDIVLALDVSGSMRAADFRPKDRITVAKDVIRKHVLTRPRDRVGLVVFAGEAFTQAPLTHDKGLLANVLDGVRSGVITDGTAIGDGLALSLARLETSKAKTRTVILLSDGDNNAGQLAPETSLAMAKELSIKVFTILVGKGGRVPFPDGVDIFGAPRYVTVDMPVNPALLKQIARDTGGSFYQATDKKSLETSFQTILEALDKSVLDGTPPVRKPLPLGVLLLLPAFVCVVAAATLRFTRGSIVP
ncbi:MAG: VWA domain-containing protein [Deltaproteobacteria bacterium]|nr:VWA domain-containing protein [Deltaproteobacteria bacterium]